MDEKRDFGEVEMIETSETLTAEQPQQADGTGVNSSVTPAAGRLLFAEEKDCQKTIVEAPKDDRLDRLIWEMGLSPKRDSATYHRYRRVLKDFAIELNQKTIDGITEACAIYLARVINGEEGANAD